VLVPMVIVTIGFGIASALAITGALSSAPDAIGAASGLYGFSQMAVGALCTLLVGIWPADHAVAAASVMLIAMLIGRGALTVATRRGFGTPDQSGT
jgi:DHA1 family bicyclomycin/chloramphenicol resistance-like MFS transporter